MSKQVHLLLNAPPLLTKSGSDSEKAIVEISKTGPPSQNSIWVKGCIFLGVPHNGSKLAHWTGILAPLGNFGGLVQTGKIKNLEQKCEILNRISDEFSQVRHAHNIPVLSCYETKKIGRVYGKLVSSLLLWHLFDYRDH